MGVVGTTRDTQATVDLVAVNNSLGSKFSFGTYQWGVRLVNTNPYTKTRLVSAGRSFGYSSNGGARNSPLK